MDEGLPSIILADFGQLVKMLIALKPRGIFDYVYILVQIGSENDKVKKKTYRKNIRQTGFVPLCARLLEYKKAS